MATARVCAVDSDATSAMDGGGGTPSLRPARALPVYLQNDVVVRSIVGAVLKAVVPTVRMRGHDRWHRSGGENDD